MMCEKCHSDAVAEVTKIGDEIRAFECFVCGHQIHEAYAIEVIGSDE